MCVKFQLSISHSSRDIKGSQILRWGVIYSLKLVPHFGLTIFWGLTDEGPWLCPKEAIVDVKFRCKVIRHLMSDLFFEMPILRVLGDFSVG